MTWVIGASTIFGYGVVISDVQVTLANGVTKDMLQKAYPISSFVVAGFAGSVRIGFMLLDSLAQLLRLPPGTEKTHAWDPIWISNNWPPMAKEVFDSAPESEKKLGSKILMLGASPTEISGLGSKTIITRFASPHFKPGVITKAIKLCSIGSGSTVTEYKTIKSLFRFHSNIHQAEAMNEGGWARAIAFSVSRVLNDHPKSGISRHLNVFHVRRGAIFEENNDEEIYFPDGKILKIGMPDIARGYEDFKNKVKKMKFNSANAIC